MTAKIINLQAWRLAHPQHSAMYSELLRVWACPLRVWLAWWGIR